MNIAFLMMTTELAGTERATIETIRALRDRGHSCTVYSLKRFGALKPILDEEGIPNEEMASRGFKGWKTFFTLRRYLNGIHPDAVILNGHDIDAALAVISVRHIRKKILVIHQHHLGKKDSWFWRLCYRVSVNRFHALVFCSRFLRHEAIALYPAVSDSGYVIHNPVPVKPLVDRDQKIVAREKLGLPAGQLIVGIAGRIETEKRLDVFLQVARRIVDEDPNVCFVVAGSGSLIGDMKQSSERLGLAGNVRWLGWLPDMQDFYISLDVLLFHSDGDAFGLSAADAMSYGVPVVASVTYGGLSELMDSEDTGVCLIHHDVSAMAQAVLALRGDRGVIVGQQARERIQVFLNPENSAIRFEALLRDQDNVR